jgi:hypothetical protein
VSNSVKVRFGALGASLVVLAALVAMATGVTGAYFSEARQGGIDGSTGSIHVHTEGGNGENGLHFNFKNLLPGEPQTATVEFKNTGASPQDVWVVFNNAEALHALNNLGTYGEVTLSNSNGVFFHSTNLNDNQYPASGTCGEFNPSGCWPVMKQYKVASDVSPGAGSYFRFTFSYASKMSNPAQEGQPWNTYPPEVEPSAIEGNGLPYQIVATQVGQEP